MGNHNSLFNSKRMLLEDSFTSVNIYEKMEEVSELKEGVEKSQKTFQSQEEDVARHDYSCIISIGMSIKPKMILVGKILSKDEIKPTPEGRLLGAIYGENF